ncbi:MAG: hypothetical protein KGL35_24410 [Bradyrhizobium sp.]|nr:hypothetical protein [Bradyrhizobium sp.]
MFGLFKKAAEPQPIPEAQWPLDDGSDYVFSSEAMDWEMGKDSRLGGHYSDECNRLVKVSELRIIELRQARECYLLALTKLADEVRQEISKDRDEQYAERFGN